MRGIHRPPQANSRMMPTLAAMGGRPDSALGFGKIADIGEAFEIGVLSPEGGVVAECGGIDEGVCHGELVADSQRGGKSGDLGRYRSYGVLLFIERMNGFGLSA